MANERVLQGDQRGEKSYTTSQTFPSRPRRIDAYLCFLMEGSPSHKTDHRPKASGRLSTTHDRRHFVVVGLIAAATLATFATDLFVPLGIAAGIPYIAPVLAAAWLPGRRYVFPVAATCTVLAVAGFLLSPAGAPEWAVVPNRVLVIAAVWTVALVVAQRKRIEDALLESEARTRAILDSSADGILTLDWDGRIASANRAAERIFGFTAEELRARPFSTLQAQGAWYDRPPSALLSKLVSDGSAPAELQGKRADGTSFPLEIAAAPLDLSSGRTYVITVRDIADRRHIEQHLLRASEEQRQSVGYDLHEKLGQSLTGLNLICRDLARRLEGSKEPDAQDAAELASLLKETDALALHLFETLVPVRADNGLPQAAQNFAKYVSQLHDVPCRIEDFGFEIEDVLRSAELFRILETAVSWSLRVGDVRDIVVRLEGPDTLNGLEIVLRGEFPPENNDWQTLLNGLDYRARLIGRNLDVNVDADGVSIRCVDPRAPRVRSVKSSPRS